MPVAVAESPRWELYRLLGEPRRLRLLGLTSEEELSIGELAELALAEAFRDYPVPRFMRKGDCEALIAELLPVA